MENSIVETTGRVAPLILEDELQNPYESPPELPQGMTNELSKSYEDKALAPIKEHKREQDARIKERLDTVYSGVRDLTNYEPDLSTEQKQRKLINGLMEVKLGRIPKDVNEYQQARFEFANKYYEGKGGESDEALFAQIKTDTDKRAANVDLHKSLQDVALVGSLDGKGFTNWLKTQEDTGMSPERKQSMLHSYNEYKQNIADQYGDSHKYAKKTFEKLMGGDIDKAMEYVNQIKGTMTDEEHENYLGLLREVVLANPEPKVEEMLTLIGLNSAPLRTLARSYRNTGKVVDSVGDLVKQAPSGIAHAVREGGTYGFAKLFGSEEAAGREKENAAKDKILAETLRKNSDFVADVKRIFRDDYDPIEPHFDGGVMGAIESGVYAAPAALTTTAMLFIPYAGLPLVGSTMFGASREKFRQRILDNGGSREEAANNADALAMITTVPNMLLERLQSLAFIGKAPMFNGAMQKVNRLFNNKLARGVGRFTIANIGETNVEMGQEYLEELVQMMGSSFSEVIPDVQWMGEGGVFDGFAYQYLSTAVAVAPLGVTASIGGVRKEDRALAYKQFPREIRAMNGVSAVDNDRIDNAETIAETVEAVQIANANADPNSDEAKDAVEAQMLREEQELTSVENLKRAGLFPMIVADKQKDGVVDIVDPQTGEVLDRIDNNPVATAQAVFSYMELQDQATQEQLDEMSTMIEAAMLDVKETGDKGAKVELDLGNKMDVRGLLEAFPEFKGRLENQVGRLEQLESKEILNGGDGGMSRAVFGLNQAVHADDVKSYTNRAYAGTSAMTLVHERGHVSWKRALESGATTLTKTYDFFKELDKNLVGKKDRNGKELRFMPEGTTADNFTALDEAVAEFSEVMLLRTRNGEKTAMRDVVGRQMSAMAKARKANAGSFKGFYQAMQDFFGKVFARNLAFKQAVKSGQINEGQLNEFYDILVKANAQEQFEKDVDAETQAMMDESSMSIGEVPAEIANSTEPLVEQIYLKETAKFKEGVESGRIKTEADIRDFIGKHMVMHQPDTAMAGEVKVDGESFVKGKGGVYYPVLFSDEGYFWASTAAKADEMAGALNEISERNGGKIFMALTSADVDKLFSSTTMSVGTMNFFKQLTKNPRKYGITENQFNKILIQASQTKITSKLLIKAGGVNVLDKNGNKTYKTKVQEFGYKLTKGNTLEQNVAEMEGWLQPFSSDKSSGSSFDVRKAFVFDMMRHVSTHLKARPEQSKAVSELLTHESNAFAKGAVLKGKLSMAAFQQGLGDMLSEPLTKTFQKFGKDGKGYVYAIIEIDGKVKAIDTKGHESYPKAIVSVDGNLPTVHIMKRGYHWTDIAQEKDSGARVPRTNAEMNKVMPTGGFSAYKGRPLQFGDVQEGAEGVDLAFSIGDARMNDTIITNAAMRMRDPEGVATVMKGIIRRIEALRRDVPRIISAFGKDVTQEAIVDAKLIGDLRAEAKQMRRDGIEAAENAVYDRYGDVLSNEDLVKLKSQPVTELVMAEGGMESISSAKRRKGDDDLTAGEYEEAAGLPPMYYGGSQSPDQMATQLFNEGFISDDSVSAMMEALEAEIMSVSNRKADLKEAKALMGKGRKAARTKAQEWLDERIAEQKRDYSPTVRARRALVKLSAIRRSMPMELRGKIEGDAKLLTMGDEARLKYLEETLAKVDKVVDEWIRKETRKSIKDAYKVLGKKKLSPETETELKIIKEFGDMTALQKNEKLTELYDLLDAQPTPAESLVLNEQVALLETYGNQKDMTSLQLVSLLETLGTVIKRGRTIRSMLAQERKANDSANKSMTVDVLSGGKGQMSEAESDENDERVRKDKQSVIKEIKHKPKKFHAQNLSFEGLLNMLSRKDKGSETYKSEISKKWGVLVHRATRTNKVANQHLQENYDAKMKQIFNKKGIRLSSHISKEMMDRQDTGFKKVDFGKTGSTTNKSIEVIVARRIINGEVDPAGLGLNERDVELITAAYEAKMSSKRTKKGDMDQVKWKHENTGKAAPLKRSQSQVMALVMMFRQDGIKQSMIKEGYSEELMANLEKSFLTKESKEVLEWMSEQYDRNYDVVNAVYRKQHGVDLPKIEFYAPVRRVVDKETDDIDITGSGTAFGTTPSQLLNRAKNFNKVDPNANAMDMFMEHMLQSNHYVSWADPIRELRATFHNKDVRRAIKDYAGGELLGVIDERIAWLADGGNRQSKKIKWLDNMRMAHTFGSLAYDLGITIKQFTSLPAYAFDMGVRNWVKYEAEFMKNPIKNAKEMIATEYVQTRFKDGYSRDVAEGLKLESGNTLEAYILKGFQAGMMFGKVGDIVPVIVGGWAAKKHAYNEAIKAGMTPKQAESQSILAFEMATDRSQQAVDMKDLSSFSGGNSAMKLFTMYKTSPRQYYAVAYEALFDAFAGRKNGWHNAARKMAISHAVLPLMFQFVSDMWRMVGDEDKELEGSDYLRAMLLGPLNGLYIAGEVAAPLASLATGARVYDAQIPAFSAINSTVRGVAKISRGDFWEGTNEIVKQAGKWTPVRALNFATYYSILTKQAKLLDRFTD